MQPLEEFMQQYFDERLVEEQREQGSRTPFRQKFHTDDCFWDSRAGTLEMIQTEKVLNVSPSGDTAEVITTRHSPHGPNSVHQLRYHLLARQGRWLIRAVDVWCHSCRGEAKPDCIFCHGTGWLDGRKPKTLSSKRDVPPSGDFKI